MKAILLAGALLAAGTSLATAQSFSVGPDGFRVQRDRATGTVATTGYAMTGNATTVSATPAAT